MLPMLLDEAFAQVFVFYWNGQLCKGLRAGNKLYKMVETFQRPWRDRAFQLGCELCEQGFETYITVSPHGYRVWVDLQCNVALSGATLSNAYVASPKLAAEA